MVKANAILHAIRAVEIAARAKSLLVVSALPEEKAARKKRIEEYTQRLEEELSVWESSVAEECTRKTSCPSMKS